MATNSTCEEALEVESSDPRWASVCFDLSLPLAFVWLGSLSGSACRFSLEMALRAASTASLVSSALLAVCLRRDLFLKILGMAEVGKERRGGDGEVRRGGEGGEEGSIREILIRCKST